MEKSYRIKANVGRDQFLNVSIKRDVDVYEVLSLKLTQEKLYKLHSSGYGVIVGRVLANDAFGIPNAKVSVFIPISSEDKLRSDVKELYPYGFINEYDTNNIRFNTLPNYQVSECHKPVGTFPSKRNVLDEDITIEVYDKYYKYTTITNNAGDYMIFGVPVGEQMIHVDIDLSDIGVLSQRPTDFIYKGYSLDLFESPSEFKQSTNLGSLPQIISENTSVNVFPLWGDKDESEIAITRKDVQVQYKFEPTCVFLGSVVTDSSVNSISQNCTPSEKMGEAGQLRASEGTIEMIRKTVDDTVEEFNIKGNQLIDANGVWCYQIPMNLDYVCTDEYGNIVPTDNPTKGIPTRARVRFRVTLNESDTESLSSHKARYLIPNNPEPYGKETVPYINEEYITGNSYYEFGTLTNDECFRDLLWNKVYSVKSYIPRVQKRNDIKGESSVEYIGIKGVNKKQASGMNPMPFNKLNLNFAIPSYYILREIWDKYDPIKLFWNFLRRNQIPYNIDAVREKVLEDMDAVGLDFYNDWLNGCLYFPSWYWYISSRKIDENSNDKYDGQFCDCDKEFEGEDNNIKLCVLNNCSLAYTSNDLTLKKETNLLSKDITRLMTKYTYGTKKFEKGIIKRMVNKDGLSVYYYSFGQKLHPAKNIYVDKTSGEKEETKGENTDTYNAFVRLFSTDIILLGSLNDCDIHGVPKVSFNIPSTTSNIPPMGKLKPQVEDKSEEDSYIDDETFNTDKSTVNGMHWGGYWFKDLVLNPVKTDSKYHGVYKSNLASGLFFGLSKVSINWATSLFGKILGWFTLDAGDYLMPFSDYKSCVNAERICELGVTNDSDVYITLSEKNDEGEDVNQRYIISHMDGLITKREILDNDSRSLFATLNSTKMNVMADSDATGYKTYLLRYSCPINFDGRMDKLAVQYTNYPDVSITHDFRSKDYIDFRLGSISNDMSYLLEISYGQDTTNTGGRMGGRRSTRGANFSGSRKLVKTDVGGKYRHFYGEDSVSPYAFPLYDNSFYFYFGINSAHNAISEFYKNFMSRCNVKAVDPFSVKIEEKPGNICGSSDGTIKYKVKGALAPLSFSLLDKNNEDVLGDEWKSVYELQGEITGITNGKYELAIIDANGYSITKDITLKQERINLNYSITNSIQTKYRVYRDAETGEITGDNKTFICDNKLYAVFNVPSYTINGETKEITLSNAEFSGNVMVFVGDDYTITISVKEGEDIEHDYYCGNDEKNIFFGKTGLFYLRIEEKDCSSNFSDYTFNISDIGDVELYINTMPLKFFIGRNENDPEDYRGLFYNINGDADITYARGWFGVHNPRTYDSSFWGGINNFDNAEIWDSEMSYTSDTDILTAKFRKMFSVASNAYITNGTTNKITATAGGTKTLIRAAYPVYDSFIDKEQEGTFKSFVTCNKGETQNCPNNAANIVAGNFRFTDNDGRPSYDTGDVSGYDYNSKYQEKEKQAANYFAAFSNNANYVTECEQSQTAKKYVSLPYGADDLSSENLCTGNDKRDVMLSQVYGHYPYFKALFIDRRLDYDFAYVTPCTTTDRTTRDRTWANGRLSGLTYNGIEMAYNSQYVIAAKDAEGVTEYNYSGDTKRVTLNETAEAQQKKLYASELEYGGSRPLDLRELYYSKNRKEIDEDTYNNDGIKIHDHSGDGFLDDDTFDNFGLYNNHERIIGYPTKRLADAYNIPFGTGSYTWFGQSCTYPTDFETYESIKTNGAEKISHKVTYNDALDIITNEVTYGIKDDTNYIFQSTVYKHVSTIKQPSIEGLAPKFESARLIKDGSSHANILTLKTTTNQALKDVFNSFSELTVSRSNGLNIVEDVTSDNFVGIGIYHTFCNSSFDNLLKRIQLFNVTNYYNVSEITFAPDFGADGWVEVSEKGFEVDKDSIDIQVEGDSGGEETESEGSVTENPKGNTKTEKFNFLMSTKAFTYDEILTTTMDIALGAQSTYTPTVEEKGVDIKVSVVLSGNNVLITDGEEDAKIKVNITLKNGVKYIIPFTINLAGNIF